MGVEWKCRRAIRFKKSYDSLSIQQQKQAKNCYNKVFKKNPFDSALGPPHKIHKLSARYGCTVWGAHVDNEKNFCIVFRQDGQIITALDIGTHDIYK